MTGYIISSSGVETELPAFLSWDVCHGIGEPCDWFEVSFIYYSHQLSMLQSACRFRAEHNNSVVFTGVVDEYSISIDEHGSVATISGRSHAALLLDNELSAAAYAASFVRPENQNDERQRSEKLRKGAEYGYGGSHRKLFGRLHPH